MQKLSFLLIFRWPYTSQYRKMVRHTLKILQQMLSDHFTTLQSKVLSTIKIFKSIHKAYPEAYPELPQKYMKQNFKIFKLKANKWNIC